MSVLMKPTYVSSATLSTVPIVDGQQIICIDNGMQFIDFDNTRIMITNIITLKEDMERTSMSSPSNGKFYFVKETNILWHYNNAWIKLTDGFIHMESKVAPGTYIRVTTDSYGHITDANNDPIAISEGGTGGKTTQEALDNLGITDFKSNTNTRLEALEANITQILTQINNIYLTYEDGSYYIENVESEGGEV